MATVEVRDMSQQDEYFVSTCSHINESDEIDACGRSRLAWLRRAHSRGVRVEVALLNGEHAGFAYATPIELAPWGPLGRDLMVVPCVWVLPRFKGRGLGRALMQAAETEARRQGFKGVAVIAFHHDFWFMPAQAFEKMGYEVAAGRGKAAILWKRFDPSAEEPAFLEPAYRYAPVPGKVVVDLFWHTFCQTSWIEAQHVREVAAEFGDTVLLKDYCADDREVLLRHQTPRAIFVNGKEIGWGYEAPKEGIAKAISEALRQP
jgi:GNAT superfamily N-acetyltransferase